MGANEPRERSQVDSADQITFLLERISTAVETLRKIVEGEDREYATTCIHDLIFCSAKISEVAKQVWFQNVEPPQIWPLIIDYVRPQWR